MWSTADVKESTGERNFVGYGINENVQILGLAPQEGEVTGSTYIRIGFKLPEQEKDKANFQKLYMSEKARPYSINRILHLVKLFGGTKEQLDAATTSATSAESFCKAINPLIVGKGNIRLKLQGEEYKNANGELKAIGKLGFPPFAELASVPKEESKLTFDKDDERDFKRLQEATQEEELVTQESGDDLPF